MSAVAFSGDGSLVAAAVTGSVTLWDPSSNALITVLATPAPARSSAMRRLEFVPGTHFLVRPTETLPIPKTILVQLVT